jgi:hypothetical protein
MAAVSPDSSESPLDKQVWPALRRARDRPPALPVLLLLSACVTLCVRGAQLWAAAEAGETAEVSRLVAAKADINSRQPNW